jgi:diaminohydroxyphosphoribosylaminopyrimidine deaminase/5-amino-6-(5-phosphoribosylamino)uracil reductase
MKETLELAERARGLTSPDPMVGAVIVKGDNVVGRGYHAEVGTPHAESFAIKKAGPKAKGATMYVNLEPCCHYGNNPPCVDQIIKAGIKKVVAAMRDPNPLVSGKGIKKLRKFGVDVKVGLLEREARVLNESFVRFITARKPFVILKSAMSIDGKIATPSGESRWITGRRARAAVHKIRSTVDAVMIGIGTAIKDNPRLTARIKGGRNPLKIIIDPRAEIPLRQKALTYEPEKTIVVVSERAPKAKIIKIERTGARILILPSKKGVIDLKMLMKLLAGDGVVSIMIEGGGELSARAIEARIVNKVLFFISPKIIGGRRAKTPVEGEGVKRLSRALQLKNIKCSGVGEDLLIEGHI